MLKKKLKNDLKVLLTRYRVSQTKEVQKETTAISLFAKSILMRVFAAIFFRFVLIVYWFSTFARKALKNYFDLINRRKNVKHRGSNLKFYVSTYMMVRLFNYLNRFTIQNRFDLLENIWARSGN